jgi:hypothetical protein
LPRGLVAAPERPNPCANNRPAGGCRRVQIER